MLRPALVLLFLLNFAVIQAQNVLWQTNYEWNLSYNSMTEMVVVDENTIYMAGAHAEPLTIDGTVYEKQFHPSNREILLLRIDSTGAVQWASQVAGAGQLVATGLAVDEEGAVYLSMAAFSNGPVAVDGDTLGTLSGRILLKYNAEEEIEGPVAVFPFNQHNDSGNMYVEGDRLYFTTRWDLYCYDLDSSEMLWERSLNAGSNASISGFLLDGADIYIGGRSPAPGGALHSATRPYRPLPDRAIFSWPGSIPRAPWIGSKATAPTIPRGRLHRWISSQKRPTGT